MVSAGRSDHLIVRLYDTPVAEVRRGSGPHRLGWSWTPEAVRRWGAGSRVVAHLLPAGTPPPEVVAGVFADGLLPEGEARIHFAVGAGIDPDDTFALLGRFGRDTAGALEFLSPDALSAVDAGTPRVLSTEDVRALLEQAGSTRRSEGLTSTSLTGLVPKIALERATDGTWMQPPPGVPSTWILKVGHPEAAVAGDVIDTEAFCLDLGRRVGVTTVHAEVMDIAGLRAIAVSRYDRARVGDRVVRIHQEDAAQMLGLNTADPTRKFQRGRDYPSWSAIARRLRADGGQLSPLARLVAFSYLVGNTDHHAKNTSILRRSDGRVSVAPAYDIAVHLHHLGPHRLALDLAGESDFDRLTAEHVVEEIRSWDVPTADARAVVQDVAEGLDGALRDIDRTAHPRVDEEVWTLVKKRATDARDRLAPPRARRSPAPEPVPALPGPIGQGLPPFADFFEAATGHRPYVWQERAAHQILQGRVPEQIGVPTGMGKTSFMIAWLWALAADLHRLAVDPQAGRSVPLRYVLVVDRRVVVDHTAALAERLATLLQGAVQAPGPLGDVARVFSGWRDTAADPLVDVRLLRGGMAERPEGPRHPCRPTVVVGTVDLIGSRLLYRGYGVSAERRPIDAALLGLDALLVLDEAHLARQLGTTLHILATRVGPRETRLNAALPPACHVVMTATPESGDGGVDWAAELASRPELALSRARRGGTSVEIMEGSRATADASLADLMGPENLDLPNGSMTIVFTNTAEQARVCAGKLARRPEKNVRVRVLIGGMPPLFRSDVLDELEHMHTGSPSRPGPDDPALVVVATSTLEVGADLDADRLITPVATMDSLIQRLGRVNRVGARAGCSVRIVTAAAGADLAKEPVHGEPAGLLGEALRTARPPDLAALEDLFTNGAAENLWRAPVADTAVMTPSVFDAYQRTAAPARRPGSPAHLTHEPEVGRWLRPPADPRLEVVLAFRRSVRVVTDDSALVEHLRSHPPGPSEVWTVPVATAKKLLKGIPRWVLLDATGREDPKVVRPPKGFDTGPGWIVILPETPDAFGIPGAGRDLVEPDPADVRSGLWLERIEKGKSSQPDFFLVAGEDGEEWPPPPGYRSEPLYDGQGRRSAWVEWSRLRVRGEAVPAFAYPLDDHQEDVERRIRIWAGRLRIGPTLTDDIALAARVHDEGKRADVVQAQMAVAVGRDGSVGRLPGADGVALAKSALPRRLWDRARRLAGVPEGYRHEAESGARLDEALSAGMVAPHDPMLVRHLVLTHHGRFRGAESAMSGSGPTPAYQDETDDRWATRAGEFAALLERYGPYTLAYAESLVRLADWYESRRIVLDGAVPDPARPRHPGPGVLPVPEVRPVQSVGAGRWRLAAVDAEMPTGYLAALGALALLRDAGAGLWFEDATPVLTADLAEADLARRIVEGVERLTAPDRSPLEPDMHTTTPSWSVLRPQCERAWEDPDLDALLGTVDVGSIKNVKELIHPQALGAALVLVTGKAYVRKAAGELWPPPKGAADHDSHREAQRSRLRRDVEKLLKGEPPLALPDATGMRFTGPDASPRSRRGAERAEIVPLLEGLALVGATQLLPRQRSWAGGRGLTWALNDNPLDLCAVVDVHERRIAPPGWPRYTADIRSHGGGDHAARFDNTHRVEDA